MGCPQNSRMNHLLTDEAILSNVFTQGVGKSCIKACRYFRSEERKKQSAKDPTTCPARGLLMIILKPCRAFHTTLGSTRGCKEDRCCACQHFCRARSDAQKS